MKRLASPFNIDDFNKTLSDLYFETERKAREAREQRRQKADDIQKIKRKTTNRTVQGRRKLPEGKKTRAENKGSTEFEMELVHYLNFILNDSESIKGYFHVFRSPASKTPVDVWEIDNAINAHFACSFVHCYQCKTTKDTRPPRIDKKEFEDFRSFCSKINAKAYWVDRWKLNKNIYIRRIRGIDIEGQFYKVADDFSPALKSALYWKKKEGI